jgi:ATP-binding cassette subfamily B protein
MQRYRFLFSLLLEHKLSYLIGAVMVGITLWLTLTIPQYLEQAIDVLRSSNSGSDGTSIDAHFSGYVLWILIFAIVIIVTRTASRLLFFIPGRRVEYDLKNRLLAHLTTLQRNYFLQNPTGSIISRVNNDINGVRMLMGFGLLQLINSLAMLSLAPYKMYQISPLLTLYVTVPLVISFFLPQIAIRRLRQLQREQMKTLQDLSDFTVASYNGLDTLRSYRALAWAEGRFTGFSLQIKDLAIRMSTIRAFFMPILTHVVNGLKVMLVLVGGMMVIEAELSIGEFVPLLGLVHARTLTLELFVQPRGLLLQPALLRVMDRANAVEFMLDRAELVHGGLVKRSLSRGILRSFD